MRNSGTSAKKPTWPWVTQIVSDGSTFQSQESLKLVLLSPLLYCPQVTGWKNSSKSLLSWMLMVGCPYSPARHRHPFPQLLGMLAANNSQLSPASKISLQRRELCSPITHYLLRESLDLIPVDVQLQSPRVLPQFEIPSQFQRFSWNSHETSAVMPPEFKFTLCRIPLLHSLTGTVPRSMSQNPLRDST